jgi:hypothetical protein
MSSLLPRRSLPAPAFALPAAALAALAIAGAAAASPGADAGHPGEPLVVRGTSTVTQEGACPAGVCRLELAGGAFRGTPVGTGAYRGTIRLGVASGFPNGEGGVCAPIRGRITLGTGTPDRLVLGLEGDSCQDGAGDPGAAAFTSLARFTVRSGTGAYAGARGGGLLSSAEDAADRERITLVGRLSR